MADPLSIAASLAGLISLGIQVTQTLTDFYVAYKHRDADIAQILDRLGRQLETLDTLNNVLARRSLKDKDDHKILKNIDGQVQDCLAIIYELKVECEKLQHTPSNDLKSTVKQIGRRAAYPFRRGTLENLDESIEVITHNLSLILNVLQIKDTQALDDELKIQKDLLTIVRASQLDTALHAWLQAPDATIDHNSALEKRHPETGRWLTDGVDFARWLNGQNSFLWLNGFAGCGKSVLCSTAIQATFQHVRSQPNTAIAFFYFAFNDRSKQDDAALLRALLLQLGGQSDDAQQLLHDLRDAHKTGSPSTAELLDTLKASVKQFENIYICIDALDESPRGRVRDSILGALTTIHDWAVSGLHLLVTSRDEVDIRDTLETLAVKEVRLRNEAIDRDIVNFVHEKLRSDRHLRKKWLNHFDEIEKVLAERAQGVFRWVECQFATLARCPRSENDLSRCLQSLPESLDETYERMLCSIDKSVAPRARRLLTLLCFSEVRLDVAEVIEGLAVDLSEPARLDPRSRLQDADDLRDICPGLIEIDWELRVRIAHFSVQEYLEAERIRDSQARYFSLASTTGHAEIAEICLTYLLIPELSQDVPSSSVLSSLHLLTYATRHWDGHVRKSGEIPYALQQQLLRLFDSERNENFRTWISHRLGVSAGVFKETEPYAERLYYAARVGCVWLVEHFVHKLEDDQQRRQLVNSMDGEMNTALQAAAYQGHEGVVRVLLDHGAETNVASTAYGSALNSTSYFSRKVIAQLLLDRGADVNLAAGYYGTALSTASYFGRKEMVQLFIDHGADINVVASEYGTALGSASASGHQEVVQLLLDYGADVNKTWFRGTSIETKQCCRMLRQLILKNDVDIHTLATGQADTVLEIIAKIVQDLRQEHFRNAVLWFQFGTAVRGASFAGSVKTVQLLVDAGADVNLSDDPDVSALMLALLESNWEVAKVLIKAGARISPDMNQVEIDSNKR